MKRSLQIKMLALVLVILSGCANPQKLIESGEYDRAIRLSAGKMSGKSKKKHKYVVAIEDAFRKVTAADMKQIAYLKKEGREENWITINRMYNDIKERQDRIKPFLPLVDKDGYRATFKFVNVEELSIESRRKTASYHYKRAEGLLIKSEKTGDRRAARDAYDELNHIEHIYANYKDKDQLKDKALYLGRENWLVSVTNDAHVFLPARFEEDLLSFDIGDLNSTWRSYYLEEAEEVQYDYMATLRVKTVDVSPQREKERQFDESKEIEDGFDYVLDSKGNVLKDSLGNDVTTPRKVFIKATVLEIFQSKYATVGGILEVKDTRNGDLLYAEPAEVEVVFEHYASTLLGGDKRALKRETKNNLGSRPAQFPPDEMMLMDAAGLLKEKVKNGLYKYRSI